MTVSRTAFSIEIWASLGALIALTGCREPVYTATLEVGEGVAVAGVPQGYKYSVKDQDGETHTGDAKLLSLISAPEAGVTQETGALIFTIATSHRITADLEIEGQSLEASTVVEVIAAAADHVSLTADPLSPRAGDSVAFKPLVVDAYGNAASPPGSFKLSVSPMSGVTLGAQSATFTKVGEYRVTATDLQRGWEDTVDIDVILGEVQRTRLDVSSTRLQPGQTLTATLIGIDGFGNEGSLDATYQVTPMTGVSINEDSIRFASAGQFDVAAISGEFESHASITVDGTAPELVLESPERATFQTNANVTFVGTVTDDLAGIQSVTLNGAEVRVLGNQFTYDYPAAPGTNIVELKATDLNGNSTSISQSFVWGPEWSPVATPSAGGLYGRLNQGTLDLVCDLLELELNADALEADLMAENPIATYEDVGITAVVTIEAFDYTAVNVTLDPSPNGPTGELRIGAAFDNMYARLRAVGEAWFDDYNVTGELSASLGSVVGYASVTVVDGVPKVTIDPNRLTVAFNDFDVSFSGTVLNAVGEALEGTIEDALIDELKTYINDEVPPFLEEYLNYLNYSYTTPVAIGDISTELTISTRLEGLRFDDTGATLAETTVISAPIDPRMPENPGAPRVGASNLSYGPTPGYLLSASFDALNTLLHTVWMSGILVYDYTVVADSGQSFTAAIDLPLPPLVQPSLDTEYVIDATAGDIYLDLFLDPTQPATYKLAVSLVVPATVVTAEGGVQVSVLFGEPQVTYQVLEAPSRGLDSAALGALVEELVNELLNEAEGSLANLVLPEFEGYQLTISAVDARGDGWGWLTVGGELAY